MARRALIAASASHHLSVALNQKSEPKATPALLPLFWKQFSSMRFAIILLLILAIVSVLALFIGEFYPVHANSADWKEFWQKELKLSKPVFNFLVFLELHDPYRSWWYQLLLLLLSVSLFACILDRLPIVLRGMKLGQPRSAAEVGSLPLYRTFKSTRTVNEIKKRLPRLFRYRENKTDEETRLVGSHAAFSSFGPILAHAGLLALAVGGLAASLGGFKTRVGGLPGDLLTDPGFDFTVRVDSFRIEYYPLGIGQYVLVENQYLGKIISKTKDGQYQVEARAHDDHMVTKTYPAEHLKNQFDIEMDRGNISDYISSLTVLENDQEVKKQSIEVNKPLRHKGFRFYQSSFDPEHPVVQATVDSAVLVIKRAADGVVLDTVTLGSDDAVLLPDGSELHLTRFLPDFRMSGGKPTSASAQLHNPALLLTVKQQEQELYHQWAFLKMDFPHTEEQAAYDFQALDVFGVNSQVTYPTILDVNKNPGSWIIWLGFILATLGLIISLYLVPQRLWVVIKKLPDHRAEVHLAGSSTKNPDLFQQKFEHWVKHLQG